jgi:hypothetical protein
MEFLMNVGNGFENFLLVIAGEKTDATDLIVLQNIQGLLLAQ